MNCCNLVSLLIHYHLSDDLFPKSSEKLSQIKVFVDKLIIDFALLYLVEYSLLDSCVSSTLKEFDYSSVLSFLDRVI